MGALDTAAPGRDFAGRTWRFADCEFDERRRQLTIHGLPVDLEAKPLELLRQLLIHAGEVVTKRELLESVWPEVTVVDGSLATAISKLRKSLGELEEIIVTVPRVGYRLACPVESHQPVTAGLPTLDLRVGDVINGREPWRLVRRFEAGPLSQVWLAEHPKTRDLHVFKFAVDDTQLRSLKREVTLARLLREALGERPEFVRILEWNFDSPPYFIESDYAGPNLAEWFALQGGINSIPVDVRLQMLADIARAVADAHTLGVLHKDLKPGNILVSSRGDQATIKIADFGSGALLDLSRLGVFGITNVGLTHTEQEDGVLTGTMMYIAPEVLAGQSPSPASDVYAMGVLLYQLIVGEFRKPLSPGWEAEIHDPVLREDIAAAACGDPERRLTSASELADRLSTLESRRLQHEQAERQRKLEETRARSRAEARVRRPWIFVALAAVLVAAVAIATLRHKSPPPAPRVNTVAVLPFQNVAGDPSIDFLRYALPDEIATTLSHMRSLSIHSLGFARQDAGPDVHKIAQEAQVANVITGHFLRAGENIQITLEAIEIEHDRLLWRDTVNVPATKLLALQEEVSAITRGNLAASLGATEYIREKYPPASNEKAYDLYLRSMAITNVDPAPNQVAVEMLERSVALDPKYAPAWMALASRLYAASRFNGGGPSILKRSDEAAERALALDPDSIDAATALILNRTERGETDNAFHEAQDLLNRRPDNAQAHYLMSYVLRYGGALQDSAKECDASRRLEPLASSACSTTFTQLGDYGTARALLRKDLGSEWSRAHGIEILLRQGKTEEALRLDAPRIPGWESYRMLLACARHEPNAQIASMARTLRPDDDPEVTYLFAGHLAYCGQTQASVRMLKAAVDGHYCSYPAIDVDPFFDSIRSSAAFEEVRESAISCRSQFDKMRSPAP